MHELSVCDPKQGSQGTDLKDTFDFCNFQSYFTAKSPKVILVPRVRIRDPFGQHQDSRTLAGTDRTNILIGC